MAKIPIGSIPVSEAFQRYYDRLYADASSLVDLTPGARLEQEGERSTAAQKKFEEAFVDGKLEARIHDGSRELTITPGQWQDTCSPGRAFFGGPIEDCHDGPLADYRGLYPYIDEAAFDQWLAKILAADKKAATAAEECKCKQWLIDQMQNGPRGRRKPDYLKEAQSLFWVTERGFNRMWDVAIAETGRADLSQRGRKKLGR
jgi:hypothetical protein